ncbi:unnamed protein product [Dracunculus medinensis]|uniref:DUF3099 domain-containing protein n=1 Tax=Dracunculus medinensis TaxID=318479 RepID=A0A0N4UEV0_DRAME|nr:unnamed protein product [Dracunculus medinensis]
MPFSHELSETSVPGPVIARRRWTSDKQATSTRYLGRVWIMIVTSGSVLTFHATTAKHLAARAESFPW